MQVELPDRISINGISYVRGDVYYQSGEKVRPKSIICKDGSHSHLLQVCPNDNKSWGSCITSECYRFCATCGCEIDRKCFFDRIEKFRKMQNSGELVDGYVFGDDE